MNKKLYINIFFIAIYTLSLFTPIVPLVEYALNYKYISEVLCVNKDKPQMSCSGKCYLKKQVKASVEKTIPNQKEPKNNTLPYDFRVAVVHKIYKGQLGISKTKKNHFSYIKTLTSISIEIEDKPPILLV